MRLAVGKSRDFVKSRKGGTRGDMHSIDETH